MPTATLPSPTRPHFVRTIEAPRSGLRVRWVLVRDVVGGVPFTVVATEHGVYLCGKSPALGHAAMKTLADVLGEADVAAWSIRDGISAEQMRGVFREMDRESEVGAAVL